MATSREDSWREASAPEAAPAPWHLGSSRTGIARGRRGREHAIASRAVDTLRSRRARVETADELRRAGAERDERSQATGLARARPRALPSVGVSARSASKIEIVSAPAARSRGDAPRKPTRRNGLGVSEIRRSRIGAMCPMRKRRRPQRLRAHRQAQAGRSSRPMRCRSPGPRRDTARRDSAAARHSSPKARREERAARRRRVPRGAESGDRILA